MGFEALAQLKEKELASREKELGEFKQSHSRDQWNAFRILQIIRTFGKGTFTASDLVNQTTIQRNEILPVLNRWRTAGALEIVGPERQVYNNFDGVETKYHAIDLGLIEFEPLPVQPVPVEVTTKDAMPKRPKRPERSLSVSYQVCQILLDKYPVGAEFTANQIANQIGAVPDNVSAALVNLINRGILKRGGMDGRSRIVKMPDKDALKAWFLNAPKMSSKGKTRNCASKVAATTPNPAPVEYRKPVEKERPAIKPTPPGNQFLVHTFEGDWIVCKIAVREINGTLKVVWLDHRNTVVAHVSEEQTISRLPA